MQGVEIKQIILRVPSEIHQKLKILASMQGKTMERLIVELIEREWEESGLERKERDAVRGS